MDTTTMVSETIPAAVYTCLLGGYEELNDDQARSDSGIPYICFTDDPVLASQVWDIRLIQPRFPRDLQRSQRDIKLRGHHDLDRFARTLYIDNSVSLRVPPETFLSTFLGDAELAIPLHSYRETVLDEFVTVANHGLDEPTRIYEQLAHYQAEYPEALREVPLWNAIIARLRTPRVDEFMNRWFDEVLRYSRRDQLSTNAMLMASGVDARRVELDNYESSLHSWPVAPRYRPYHGAQGPGTYVPDVARMKLMEAEIRTLKADRESTALELARLREREAELFAVEADRARLAAHLEQMTSSRSWQVTAPLRALRRSARRR
jgi:hypothetical protein